MFDYTENDKEKIIKGYFMSLKPLRLRLFPPKQKKQFIALSIIMEKIDVNVEYTEKELNEVLIEIYPDYVTIRRGLIDYQFMTRDKYGKKYWVIKK